MTLEEKIIHAQNVLKVANKLSKTYYKKPLAVCYSGGKDSDVLLDIAIKTLAPEDFVVINTHTTLDAPETVYHIRNKFKDLKEHGFNCEIKYPYYKGERTSFWKICREKYMLPTRIVRFCCSVLKEVSTPQQVAALGVRESESNGREGRDDFGTREKRKADAIFKSAQHTNAMIDFDQDPNNESSFECEIIKNAKIKKDIVCNPIYKFTGYDVWAYIKTYKIEVNPLYKEGFKRIGCVGCPMSNKGRKKEFVRFPKYEYNFRKLADRLYQDRIEKGLECKSFKSGEDMFKWWMEEDPNQITFDDLLK